ncbi:MAG: bifunctional 5,10-methylenetetrahydrofolate dehydrogenase/5,10-methenyltetrahydrofolate cyclohydrolase [Clostridiales bacterium]|nr:bifunctional 5,10-methylenetetrahydrofolate dehydrogenase/5,10-methenyltetrahydrofolate cyclohydrolase [Candidatus Crickella caballi]
MFNELPGAPVKEHIEEFIISSVGDFNNKDIYPKIAVIRAGDDPGLLFYEDAIVKAAERYGIEVQLISFDKDVNQRYVELALEAKNMDNDVHGIILLRPFPEHIDEEALRAKLIPSKDIDAVTDISIAGIFAGKDTFMACTADAAMELLKHYNIDVCGKKVAILGRSITVGRPLTMMMINADATVTVCNSRTPHEDAVAACRNADIVVLATGLTEYYGSEFFRDGQIVIDIGTGTGKDGKMHGDLNIEEIRESGVISDLTYTPVPGGVGVVTTAILMRNVIRAARVE